MIFLKNYEKYKTTEERIEAFKKQCGPFASSPFLAGVAETLKLLEKETTEGTIQDASAYTSFIVGMARVLKWLDEKAIDEPRPCPFCNGGKAIVKKVHRKQFAVRCQRCNITTGAFSSVEEAINFWNHPV